MDKKNQTPSKRKQSADILTKKVVKELYEMANSMKSGTEQEKEEMCKIIQNTDSIDCAKIRYMLETEQINQNLVNFSISSALKLMKDNVGNNKVLTKDALINQPWEIISLCLIKIISSKKQCSDSSIFTEQFLNSTVQKLIQMLLLKPQQLKQIPFTQLFTKPTTTPSLPSTQISIIKSWNQILRFYTLVLSLPFIKTQLILTLTSILQKDPNIKKQFDSNTYKLQNWLSKRQLSFQNIIQILQLTINTQSNINYFRTKQYQQTKPKFIDINPHYKCLIPVVLNQLTQLIGESRQKLIVFIIGKLCFNDSYFLEDVFKLYKFQRHKDVLDTVFKYLKFHYMKSISIKKMKILLQFLRQESTEYKETEDSLLIVKLQKIVGLMSDFSRHHNQSIPSIDFGIQSNITLQKVCVGQQTVVMFIDINRFQQKMEIVSFDLGTKQNQKISVSFQIELSKRKIVAVVQNNNKRLFEEDLCYENQNNNQFLFVLKFTSKSIEICINSIKMQILTQKMPFKKFQNILNIEIGKIKRKKGCFDNFYSFKGKLKLFYVFPFIVDDIQLIYGNFTSHYREHLSEFQNMFAISPTISITKGDSDKNFFHNNKQKRFIPTTLKYSENRDNVFMNKIPSMLDIVKELESYDLFLFLIFHLNEKLGDKAERMIGEIFNIMKNLAISDKNQSCLQWMYQKDNDKQLMGLAHFLRLLFAKQRTKKTQSSQSNNQKQVLILYVLSFIFYFQQIQKRKKDTQQCQRKKAEYKMLTIQIIVKILLNFDIWGECSSVVQMRILSQIRKRLKSNKNNDIMSMIKDSIIDQNKWVKIRTEVAQNNGICQYTSNPNRILNSLLIVLFLHNQEFHQKQIQKPYNACLNTSLGMMTQSSSTSISTNISQTTPNFSAQNQWMQQIRCQVIDLINMMINVPNNQQKSQEIYSSQIQLLFQFIIYCNKKQQFRNNSSCYLLLNYIYLSISTDSSSRFNNFFLGKTQSPYYSQSNCLFVALLIQTLPCNLLESLKLILEIVKQLIIKIQKRTIEKSKGNEIKNDYHSKRFVRQTIEAYRSSSTQFEAQYMLCIFNWIVDNKYGQKKIFALCKAVRSKIKYFDQLKELETLVLKLPQQRLILLTNNPQFMYLLEISNPSQNEKNKICILVNNLYLKIHQTDPTKATQFYNMYLQICHPFSFSQIHSQNHDFPKVFSYADANDMISIIPTLTTTPKLQGCYNTQLIPVCLQNISHLGGSFAHYMLKCQVSNSLIQKIDSFQINLSPQSYTQIDNLIQYFSSDIILFKMLAKEINDALLEKSFQFIKKHKTQIVKNINIFFDLYQQMIDFIDKISTIYDTDILKNEKREGLMQGLKKVYCQLNYQIQQKFSKEKKEKEQSSLSTFVEKLLSSQNIEEFNHILEQNDEQKEDVRDLIKIYSTKDLILANRLYQLNLQHFQTKQESNIIQPSSNSLKQQVFTTIERIIGYELDNIDNNSKKAEEEWKRIVGKNQHWIEKGVPKGAIYKVDLHQCPNFYHLNIKVSKTSQKKGYPRRNQFVIQSQGKLELSRKGSIRNKSKSSMSIPNSAHSQQSHTSPKKIIPVVKQERPKGTFKITKYFCEYVTQKGVYFGKIFYNRYCKQIEFHTISQTQRQKQRQYIHSTSKYHRLEGPKSKTILLDESCEIFTRRYILRHTAIQIFTKNKSYFFNIFKRKQRDMFLSQIKDVNKIIDRRKVFNEKQFTKKWLKGELNNFQYLMILNRYSGRSHNDLSQYPVFPWVLSEYSTRNYMEKLRPLDLPIGKLNDQRFQGYVLRMKQGGFSEDEKFLYGTFYSNPTVMYNFFIRLEPFITLHWQHQGKKIDHADRLFSGIQEQYSSATTNTSDVKQLIPEFYYWPEFLRNRNQFQLGKKQKGGQVNDIELPCWANTPQQFIFKNRAALQSPQVSQNLHQWIDLIFGFKSIYKNALQNNNLFHPLMYQIQSTQNQQNDIFTTFKDDQDLIVAQLTISQFGQVPEPLFFEPHVQKKGRKGIEIDGCSESVQYKDAFKLLFYTVEQISWAVIISKSSASFLNLFYTQLKKNTTEYKLKSQNKLNDNQYLHYDYKIINGSNRVISRLINGVLEIFVKQQLKFSKKIEAQTYAITSDQKIVYGVNNKIYKQKIDSRYKGLRQENKQNLSGHHDRIYKLAINEGIDILLSIDRDNLVLIHYLSSFKFLRQFSLEMAPKQMIKQVRIHDMGYFLFFTTSERILLYTFFGELFVQTDFVTQIQSQRLTNIQFLSGYESSILLSSTHGYIYMVSWFDIWKQRKMFPYRPFNLKKRKNHHKNQIQCQLLHSCQNYDFNDQQISKTQDTKKQIINFYISNEYMQDSKSPFQYQLVVLYISGKIRIFSERLKRQKTAQGNAIFKQMGFY